MDELISRATAKFQACNWSVKPNAVIYDGIKEAIKSQLDMAPVSTRLLRSKEYLYPCI